MKIASISTNGNIFVVWINPEREEFVQIGEVVRFTAHVATHSLYVWSFSAGHHADVSIGMKLGDSAGSSLFLKGAATKTGNGVFEMSGSDFLQSFVGRMTGTERLFVSRLFNQDWDWVNRYIEVTAWLHRCRERFGL